MQHEIVCPFCKEIYYTELPKEVIAVLEAAKRLYSRLDKYILEKPVVERVEIVLRMADVCSNFEDAIHALEESEKVGCNQWEEEA